MNENTSHSLVDGRATDFLTTRNRGLQYGDGLFETLAVANGRPRHRERHWRRLQRGCERLAIPAPDVDLLETEALRLSAGHERAVLKLILTRGGTHRGYRAEADAGPVRIWRIHPWPDYPVRNAKEGVAVRVCHTALARQPRLAGLKHLNRLEQVLARNEWQQEYEEGLMLDTGGYVIEGVSSNLFLFRQGTLQTPILDQCGVAGVTRERVMEAAGGLGWPVQEVSLSLEDLLAADEIFLANTLIGVWPVRRIDRTSPAPSSHRFAVGANTRRLQEQLARD